MNDIAIYSLPSMEPVSVGYNAHSYWIFDIVWLDDQHVVSGAGDNRLALWSIDSTNNGPTSSSNATGKSASSFINQSVSSSIASASPRSSSMLATTNYSPSSRSHVHSHRPTLSRSWSSQHTRSFNKLTRTDRRHLKRPLNGPGPATVSSPSRYRSPVVVNRSPFFHNFYSANSGRTTRASTAAAAQAAATAGASSSSSSAAAATANTVSGSHSGSSTHANFATSSIAANSSFFRHRFNFRYDLPAHSAHIYNINNYRAGRNHVATSNQSRGSNGSNSNGSSGISIRSPM